MRQCLGNWLPPLLWAAVIFIISAQPSLPGIHDFLTDTLIKKGGHVAEYTVLATLLARAIAGGRPLERATLLAALVVASVYAISDEWHQSFVPGRTARLVDWGVDTVGAGLGLLVMAWYSRRRGIDHVE